MPVKILLTIMITLHTDMDINNYNLREFSIILPKLQGLQIMCYSMVSITKCLYITDIVYDDTLMRVQQNIGRVQQNIGRVQWNIGRVHHYWVFTLELWNGTIFMHVLHNYSPGPEHLGFQFFQCSVEHAHPNKTVDVD